MSRCPARSRTPIAAGDGRENQRRIGEWRQIDEDDALAEFALQPCSDLEGEAGLPATSRTSQGHQPDIAAAQNGGERGEFPIPAEERSEGQRERGTATRSGVRRVRQRSGPCRGEERLPVRWVERKRIGEHAHRGQMRRAAHPPFQVADPTQAQPGAAWPALPETGPRRFADVAGDRRTR